MKIHKFQFSIYLFFSLVFFTGASLRSPVPERNTKVSIEGEKFLINGTPTYQGKSWTTADGQSFPMEGLLFNARMVQGVFDDLNPKTRGQWVYPDTKTWDPDRNTEEFIQAMALWKAHGLLGFTLNLQGGCPYGYCNSFPWDNSAFNPDGALREAFMDRTERILDQADKLGMVVILGLFYFGEDQNLTDEAAVKNAVGNAVTWVLEKGFGNVLIEINNECSVGAYDHDILKCERVHELITLAKEIKYQENRLYVSTSLAGGHVPGDEIVAASDFILIHGNGVQNPDRITEISQEIRSKAVYTPKPLVNNEDDIPWRNPDQGWQEDGNNFVKSVKSFTGWGFFDFRLPEENEDFNLGFQSIPVNWQLSSDRKRAFFNLLAKITDSPGSPCIDLEFSDQFGLINKIMVSEWPEDMKITKFEWVVNNKVVEKFPEIPETFDFSPLKLPDLQKEHWIKGRLTYTWDQQEIIVETPYYKNPWWPYVGPK
jgi:hypothetical protein